MGVMASMTTGCIQKDTRGHHSGSVDVFIIRLEFQLFIRENSECSSSLADSFSLFFPNCFDVLNRFHHNLRVHENNLFGKLLSISIVQQILIYMRKCVSIALCFNVFSNDSL